VSARIIRFEPPFRGREDEERFKASVDEDGSIRIAVGNPQGQQTWTLTAGQAVDLVAFLNNDWTTRVR
jgi:hypothetical protein